MPICQWKITRHLSLQAISTSDLSPGVNDDEGEQDNSKHHQIGNMNGKR